jgi:hypothetical protein
MTYIISKEVDSACLNCTRLGNGCAGGVPRTNVSMSCRRTPDATWNGDHGGFTVKEAASEVH